MASLSDSPDRYGLVTRVLHWGMALLFAAQFLSAGLRWALPREDPLREAFWSYHANLGMTLFLLVFIRGIWGLANLRQRPGHSGIMGRAAAAGHLAIYALMVIVPAVRIIAAAGSTRGLSYLGIPIFPARDVEVKWLTALSEWHGEMGWLLGLLVLGHITLAIGWHGIIKKDGTLKRMTG